MRFLRHLAAAAAAVTVITGLGLLWAHVSGGGTIGSGSGGAPPREVLLRMRHIKDGAVTVHSGTGFHLTDTNDLIRTCVIEAVLAAVVITASAIRRRQRRIRRSASANV